MIRGCYSYPTKASHLNDTALRRPKMQLETQFAKTSKSFTPPPYVDNTDWADINALTGTEVWRQGWRQFFLVRSQATVTSLLERFIYIF